MTSATREEEATDEVQEAEASVQEDDDDQEAETEGTKETEDEHSLGAPEPKSDQRNDVSDSKPFNSNQKGMRGSSSKVMFGDLINAICFTAFSPLYLYLWRVASPEEVGPRNTCLAFLLTTFFSWLSV